MPRRNFNAADKPRQPRTTHVIFDTVTGRLSASGTKRDMQELAEMCNSAEGSWRYHVKPIHK